MSRINLSPYKVSKNCKGNPIVTSDYNTFEAFSSEEEAQKAARLVNKAFSLGYILAQQEMQRALGVIS